MSPLIEITNLTKRIKDKTILSEINLRLEEGNIYGFIGPNGSGKTMLLRAIAGLLYINEGSVKYNSAITKGIIIENPAFINSFTGLENLHYLASIRSVINIDDIRTVMQRVGLDPNDTRHVKGYSLGMKQKLAFAQAIMESPSLLILDEPTRGLDSESVIAVRNILIEEQKNGTTILLASHNKEDIKNLCNQVFFIESGRIINRSQFSPSLV